jgi:hypothetical protein
MAIVTNEDVGQSHLPSYPSMLRCVVSLSCKIEIGNMRSNLLTQHQNPVVVERAKKFARSKTESRCGKPTPGPVRKTHTENRKIPVRKTHTTGSPQNPALLSRSRGGGAGSSVSHSGDGGAGAVALVESMTHSEREGKDARRHH